MLLHAVVIVTFKTITRYIELPLKNITLLVMLHNSFATFSHCQLAVAVLTVVSC